ncbi:MAG: TolC family protein [Ferruginibacter sp.]
MKHTRQGILLIVFFGFSGSFAQGSMMDQISIPYLDKLIKTAKENYPRVTIHTKQIGIAQNNVNKLKLSWFDGLGVYYLYNPVTAAGGTINPTNNTSGFQLGFSFNVGSLLTKPAQIHAAKGDKEVAILEKKEYELTIEADVKERYYIYVKQLTILKQRTQLSLDAQTMLTSVRSKFERGQETLQNYTNALIFLNQQNQEQINTETQLLIAKSDLEELLNKKLEAVETEEAKEVK